MSKEPGIPVTQAIRLLRDKGAAFEPALYDYVDHGGTQHAAAELGVDEHATVKTIVMETDTKQPLIVLMHGDRDISAKQMARILNIKSLSVNKQLHFRRLSATISRHERYSIMDGIGRTVGSRGTRRAQTETRRKTKIPTKTRWRTPAPGTAASIRRNRVCVAHWLPMESLAGRAFWQCQFHPQILPTLGAERCIRASVAERACGI